jgi:two-component system, chemotaxis family, protein-glutamate methylesterase/glutaminase
MKRDIIVIGGSAGSLRIVRTIISGLPKDLAAAVCVVIHTPARSKSEMVFLLERWGLLPALEAIEGMSLQPGHIYVPAPDHHLMIGDDHLHLTRGPKEGLHRPSINVTFRSAAQTHGERTIGVLLSGMQDDGASGLWEITRNGGVAIIQDPSEAEYPAMPLNAQEDAPVHFRLFSRDIARVLERLVKGEGVPDPSPRNGASVAEQFSGFTCPECRGPLLRRQLTPSVVEFRCRVGHTFSPDALLEEHTSTQECKLYEAIVALEEGASLAEFMAGRSQGEQREEFVKEAEQLRQHVAEIRMMIEKRIMSTSQI